MEARQRAKRVLDLCAHELKDVPIWAQMNLETAIEAEIIQHGQFELARVNNKNMKEWVKTYYPNLHHSIEKEAVQLKLKRQKK